MSYILIPGLPSPAGGSTQHKDHSYTLIYLRQESWGYFYQKSYILTFSLTSPSAKVYSCIATYLCQHWWHSIMYAMVASIPHDITFGMCNVGCKGIPHDFMVWFFDHVVYFFKTTENFNLWYLKIRNYKKYYGIKIKINSCGVWGLCAITYMF